MVFQWFLVTKTIASNGFPMVPMVANHWSDDGMVTIHRSGLNATVAAEDMTMPYWQFHSVLAKWGES